MRVCYVTHDSNITGANRSMLDLIDGISNADFTPFVIMRRDGMLREELERKGIKYKIIPYGSTLRSPKYYRNGLKRIYNWISIRRVGRALKKENIDIVHNNDMMCRIGAEAAFLKKIPYVCHLRDMIQEDHKREFDDEKREGFILDHAACVICISEYVYKKFYPFMVKQKNIRTIYNGINAKNYYIKDKDILKDNNVRISIVGRISAAKRQLEAAQAIAILKEQGFNNLELFMIGQLNDMRDSEYIDRVREYISNNQLNNVHIIPFTRKVIELQKGMDIGLMCSDHEAMGRTTIESMLAGNVTIGANSGATPELVVENRNGYLYECGNPLSLANKIKTIICNREDAVMVAKEGQREAMEKYDISEYGAKIYEIYKEIIMEKQNI